MASNTIERDTLIRQIAQMKERIQKIERTLQGQPIAGVKIKDLNWDKGSGGTLRLGGQNNTDGTLNIYDAFGNLTGVINKDGIVIYNGAIQVQNGDGLITLDGGGIVSSVNFTNSVEAYGTNQTITSTTYTDFVNSSRDIVVTRDTLCLFSLVTPMHINESVGNTGSVVVFIDINGVKSNSGAIFISSGVGNRRTYSITYLKVLPAGTNTCKVTARFETKTGSPELNVAEYTFSYVLFGT